MSTKKILEQLNIKSQCKKYGISLWQCPQFLFLLMGLIIVVTIIVSYNIGTHYIGDPLVVALIVLGFSAVLFIIAAIIIRSFERLAETNRIKSEFINIASHQLRSPLSNLKWGLEVIMSKKIGSFSEQQAEYFKIFQDNLIRMEELIKNLLMVSRIENTDFPSEKKHFSLKEIVEESIKEFKLLAEASHVEIKFEGEKNLPEVFADPSQIKLVINSLLDNAIRYIKDRGIVSIKLQNCKKYIYFEITDTGVGISKKDQKYVFQKFFRAENTMRYQTQGNGLSLFIAKAIIKNSGGKIGFKSQEGVGSTFWFTLPIK